MRHGTMTSARVRGRWKAGEAWEAEVGVGGIDAFIRIQAFKRARVTSTGQLTTGVPRASYQIP